MGAVEDINELVNADIEGLFAICAGDEVRGSHYRGFAAGSLSPFYATLFVRGWADSETGMTEVVQEGVVGAS